MAKKKKKRAKNKKSIPPIDKQPQTVQAPAKSLWRSLPRRVVAAFGAVATLVSLLAAAYYFIPWVKVEATSSIIDPNKPFTTVFLVSNLSPLTLRHVSIGCAYLMLHFPQGHPSTVMEDPKIEWLSNPDDFPIPPYGQHAFTCPERITMNAGSSRIEPDAVRSAVGVMFNVLFTPKIERKQFFDATVDSKGRLLWLPVSAFYPAQPAFPDPRSLHKLFTIPTIPSR